MASEPEVDADAVDRPFRRDLIDIGAFIGLFGSVALFGVFIYFHWGHEKWGQLAFLHIRLTLGLPAAAVGAFTIVTLFRTTDGKIKFRIPGVVFEGASGPILMWILCFVTIVGGIRILS